jgi:medium-chain acyl-[acyl-carrier-protein] hydrolase
MIDAKALVLFGSSNVLNRRIGEVMFDQKTQHIEIRSQSNWVANDPRHRLNASLRLFCFPYAGGGVAPYYAWTNLIHPEIELLRIQLPGRETRLREPPFTELSSLVQTLAMELKPWLDVPYAFYGHSMGALIAFELILRLRETSSPLPLHLFVSSFRAPHLQDPDPVSPDLPEPQFIEKLQQYDGINEAVFMNSELIEIFLPILRADFSLLDSYQYKENEPLACPITVFGGLTDPKINRMEISSWNRLTTGDFNCHFFPGGHFFINESQTEMLSYMNRYLAQSIND